MSNPHSEAFASIPDVSSLIAQPYAKSLTDKTLEKTFINYSKALHASQVDPTMRCAKRCGNMYTASLYGGLASLISTKDSSELQGKRISMFAYGSGAAASFFAIRVKGDTTEMREKMDLLARLDAMDVVPCQEFVDALMVRNKEPSLYCQQETKSLSLLLNHSFARRTITPPHTSPPALWIRCGQALTTLRASTPSTVGSTPLSQTKLKFLVRFLKFPFHGCFSVFAAIATVLWDASYIIIEPLSSIPIQVLVNVQNMC